MCADFSFKVDQLEMVGVNGQKFPAIRKHLAENIAGVYKDMDTSWVQVHKKECGKV